MTPEMLNPAAAGTANGVRDASPLSLPPHHNHRRHADASGPLTFLLPPDTVFITVPGREAQTMRLLIQTGPHGLTSGEASPLRWARRTGAYVHKLRGLGVPIQTTRERVADAVIGRYTLAGPVMVVGSGEG
jgi:hypothetical protein